MLREGESTFKAESILALAHIIVIPSRAVAEQVISHVTHILGMLNSLAHHTADGPQGSLCSDQPQEANKGTDFLDKRVSVKAHNDAHIVEQLCSHKPSPCTPGSPQTIHPSDTRVRPVCLPPTKSAEALHIFKIH